MTPQLKGAIALNAVSCATAATAVCAAIDTLGFDWATLDVWATTQVDTNLSSGPYVFKLTECDTSSGTYADITGFRGGSATATNVDFLMGTPAAATNVPMYKFNVDLRARKRYLKLAITTGSGTQTWYAYANLGRGEQSPSTAAKAGVLSLIEG